MTNPTPRAQTEQTYMLREIHEQPEAVHQALEGAREVVRGIATEVAGRGVDLIVIAARGTSDHAALYAQYLFQYLNGIPVALATPSLMTIYGATVRYDHALVIGVSQSGESPDVVEVVSKSRAAGAYTVAITNVAQSPLAAAADVALLCHAGVERSVAATKTYTTTCAVFAALAAALPGGEPLWCCLDDLPSLVQAALATEETVARGVVRYTHARDCVVLGRSFQYSTAREAALKLEETCYLIATPFSTADFRHGPAALAERGLPVMLFGAPGPTTADAIELLGWLRERGADCVVIGQEKRVLDLATVAIPLQLPTLRGTDGSDRAASTALGGHASVDELLAPIAYVVPGQLFAHYLALQKGLNPDKPRSLTKVTHTL